MSSWLYRPTLAAPEWALLGPVTWTVYAIGCKVSRVNPSGELWRAQRNGVALRDEQQRARSWRSRDAAMRACEALATREK